MASNKQPKLSDWIKAFRLRTLPLSVSGILVGSALSYRTDSLRPVLLVLAIFTVLFLQILSNLANDLGDHLKGTDNDKRVGPARATQSGVITAQQMKNAIYIFAVLSLLSGGILAYLGTRDMRFEVQITFYLLALACILAALGYTLGKKAYGYLGLGDLFVFLFFGLLSVCGIYTLMAKTWDWHTLFPAIAIGLLSAAVLNLNNLRDHQNDAACGKNTLIVKIGFVNGLKYHFALLLLPILATVYFAFVTEFWWCTLALLSYIPLGKHLLFVVKNPKPESLDSQLAVVALSTFLYAILFSLNCLMAA